MIYIVAALVLALAALALYHNKRVEGLEWMLQQERAKLIILRKELK